MSERATKSANRIREEIPIIRVLADYGYEVDSRGEDREQQFSCDLHGDGSDNKPSGRAYPDSSQFFCFACARSRDAIALVIEKENITFWEAVKFLEKKYGLEPLPWDDSEEVRPKSQIQLLQESLRRTETPEQAVNRLSRFLDSTCKDRSLTPQKCAGLWEAHDRVVLHLSLGGDPAAGIEMAHRVLAAAKEALQKGVEDGS